MTNFDLAHLRIAVGSGIPIATNQVCLSLLDGRALGEMAEYCEEHGIKIIAYGCIAGGFLTDGVVGAAEPTEEALTEASWSLQKYVEGDAAAAASTVLVVVLVLRPPSCCSCCGYHAPTPAH